MNDTTAARKLRNLFAGPGPAHWTDIAYALSILGITQSDIARELGVTPSAVNRVIRGSGRSREIAMYIASLLNTTTRRLWGEAYDYPPRVRRAA